MTLAHTAHLQPQLLRAAHDLMYTVFDDMTEHDWRHGLGGLHSIAVRGDEVLAHASLVQRQVIADGRTLRCGYVEAVGVRPDVQRRGIGSMVMQPLERALVRAYEIGALGATDDGARFYTARGWQLWRGRCSALTPHGVVATPEEQGAIFVLPTSIAVNLDGELTCDWREGDVW